ncbi:MAG: hypothetical protein GXY86_00735, partial [Firmicutes bacterium]|nr:hypothetical protein [Bacillota bacterium]
MSSVGTLASSLEKFIKDAIDTLSSEVADDTISQQATNDTTSEGDNNKKSIYIDIGWTFSQGSPSGKYVLKLSGNQYTGMFSNGRIEIRKELDSVTGKGELIIKLQDGNGNATGTSYRSEIELDLPPVQTPVGLSRRLTNLGFYAGTEGTFDGRMQWAVRAFKRARMNGFERNRTEPENNDITQAFLSAVHREYGTHSGDSIPANGLSFSEVTGESSYCGMFGSRTYSRNSFERRGALNDQDPGPGQAGIWEGNSAATVENEPIAGNFKIYLRAFDPSQKEGEIRNRINLPQPIHMAQFVLFELGYWLVGGEVNDNNSRMFGATRTRNSFAPDGIFGRYTQWAVREFQCHAKFPN